MAWRRPGDKPLSDGLSRMESLLTHICVTRPQWVISILLCWLQIVEMDLWRLLCPKCFMFQYCGCLVTRHGPHLLTWIKLTQVRSRQNGHHFADDIFKRIYLNENISISINISLKFIPYGPIDNISALVHIMAWHRPGDKPLSEPTVA